MIRRQGEDFGARTNTIAYESHVLAGLLDALVFLRVRYDVAARIVADHNISTCRYGPQRERECENHSHGVTRA